MTQKALKQHLENITVEAIETWRIENCFSCFASGSGTNGNVQLGVDGMGGYAVKYREKGQLSATTQYLKSARKAIDRYTELISE